MPYGQSEGERALEDPFPPLVSLTGMSCPVLPSPLGGSHAAGILRQELALDRRPHLGLQGCGLGSHTAGVGCPGGGRGLLPASWSSLGVSRVQGVEGVWSGASRPWGQRPWP